MLEPIQVVLEEITRTLTGIDKNSQVALADEILAAKRIFIAGAGRSGMMARCFAMRLMHMGLQAYMVGEVVTPSFHKGDLLVIASGSGTTESLVAMAQKAQKMEGRVALVTIYPNSAIAQIANCKIIIDAPTSKGADTGTSSVQPMGSLFEQSLLLCLDYTVKILMDKTSITEEEMFGRHANLE